MGRKPQRLIPLTPEQQALVIANVPLAHYWWKRLAADCAEAREAAVDGLIRAAQGYDPARSARFTTYASLWIRAAMQDLHRKEARRVHAVPFSTIEAGNPEGRPLAVLAPPDPDPFAGEILELARCVLPEREGQVIRLHYAEGWTNVKIGRLLGVSKERVRQIRHEALARLRQYLKEDNGP